MPLGRFGESQISLKILSGSGIKLAIRWGPGCFPRVSMASGPLYLPLLLP